MLQKNIQNKSEMMEGEMQMQQLNWYGFITALLYGCMLNKNNTTYYYKRLTLNDIRDLLRNKSEMFISCFWKALSLARKDGETNV